MIYATEQQVVVTAVAIVIVALVALFVGIIYGRRRGLEEAAEEQRWEREQARARQPHGQSLGFDPDRQLVPPEVAHEAWLAHEEQALTLANEPVLEPTAVISPGEESTTAWTRRMAADMDAFLRNLIGRTDEQLREITR